ncbi:MAG: hypothetical protein K0R69_1128 [Clostridia bacterium]|nr:hypothetical protein [Clostridia bacterium]
MKNISGNALVIKEVNTNLVLKVLREKGKATKQEISKITGLSTVTIGSILQHLMRANEVIEGELSASQGGRPAKQFSYNYQCNFILILLPYEKEGAIYMRCTIADLLGKAICENDEKIEQIDVSCLESFISHYIELYPEINAVGIGLPSVETEGKIIISDYKKLIGLSISSYFKDLYHIPIKVENDVNAAASGFMQKEKRESECTMAYLYFPDQYPPGAGLFINGKLYKGKSNFAGEVNALPLGIKWNKSLYDDFDNWCEAIAKLIMVLCSILNPHYIVLTSDKLNDAHIHTVKKRCLRELEKDVLPEIMLSNDFIKDYQEGLIRETLIALEPDIALTKK